MSNTKNQERLFEILRRPLITEKSANLMASNQYTFEVLKDATKLEIKQAFELVYPGRKVKEIRTVYMPSHEKRMGLKQGRTKSSKKAILKIEGEPIEELVGA